MRKKRSVPRHNQPMPEPPGIVVNGSDGGSGNASGSSRHPELRTGTVEVARFDSDISLENSMPKITIISG